MSSTPLNDPEWDNFDRALLASAELDRPAAGALARARRVLGAATLGSAVLVSAGTSGATTSGATLVGVSVAALSKALLVGAVAGVGFVGVVNAGFSPPQESPRALVPVPRTAAPRLATPAPRANTTPGSALPQAAETASEVPTIATRENAPRSRGVQVAKSAAAEPQITSLSIEVGMLDRARAALVQKNPQAALAELDRYAQLAIERTLGREARLLRIEALRDLGRAASAAELAKQLSDEDPHGLTGQRARELVR